MEPPQKAPVAKPDPIKLAATLEPKAHVVAKPDPVGVLEAKAVLIEQPSPASVATPPPHVKSMPVMTPEKVSCTWSLGQAFGLRLLQCKASCRSWWCCNGSWWLLRRCKIA